MMRQCKSSQSQIASVTGNRDVEDHIRAKQRGDNLAACQRVAGRRCDGTIDHLKKKIEKLKEQNSTILEGALPVFIAPSRQHE